MYVDASIWIKKEMRFTDQVILQQGYPLVIRIDPTSKFTVRCLSGKIIKETS